MTTASNTFSGIDSIEPTTAGKWKISWPRTGGIYSYRVLMFTQEDLSELSSASLVTEETHFVTYISTNAPDDKPGSLLHEVKGSEVSYLVEENLQVGQVYGFKVIALDDYSQEAGQEKILYIKVKAAINGDPSDGYRGCTEGIPSTQPDDAGAFSAFIAFSYPPGVDRIVIYRDDIAVTTITDASATTYIDSGLEPAVTYVYTCEAQWRQSRTTGTNKVMVKIPNPLTSVKNYAGCLTATPSIDGSISVQFAFPDGAEKVHVYRNEALTYTSYDRNDTVFTERNLASHSLHRFRCEAVRADKKLVGSTVITVTVPDPVDSLVNFQGCVSGTPLSSSDIRINFEFPGAFTRMRVYRNGLPVLVSTDASQITFTDTSLVEGVTYSYTCEGESGSGARRLGTNAVSVRTLSTNPPTFLGLIGATGVTPASARSAVLVWGVTSGVPVASFEIYGNPGSTLNWSTTPITTAAPGDLTTTLSNLGDELPYKFGVRACSRDQNCDTNTAVHSLTLPDAGAPLTTGASGVVMNNGAAIITVPWTHSQGAVKRRHVYMKIGANPGTTDAGFNWVKSVEVTNLANPPTEITISNLNQATQYNFIVRDEDPSGNTTTNSKIVSLNTGDMTPPSFTGLSSVEQVAAAAGETSLDINFVAIVRESDNALIGASHYLFYVKVGGGNDTCTNGILHATVQSNSYNAGNPYTYRLTGLKPRTLYGVCVKARDSATNLSNTTSYAEKYTLDTTAPTFGGLDAAVYVNATGKFDLTWVASNAADIYSYRVKIWKNTTTPLETNITTLSKPHADYSSGWSLSTNDYAFTSGDTLYFLVDACDNADVIPGGTKNCTAATVDLAKSVALPDIEAPLGFPGIKAASQLTTPSEGSIVVKWFAPADWSDYRGFKIYSVDDLGGLTQLKDCACSANDCPDQLQECTVTGLVPYKNYKLHVRAYDAAGNITQLNTTSLSSTKRTTDTTAPTFFSNLSANLSNAAAVITYSAASDNQSSEGSLTYKVYRKTGSTFVSALNPAIDGTLMTAQNNLSYNDATVAEGFTYYYTVCAADSSGNQTCDGTVSSVGVVDSTPPVITSFSSNKSSASKEWTLSWVASDNSTPTGNLRIFIYQSVTLSAGTATSNDDFAENAVTQVPAGPLIGVTSLQHVRGPANVNRYINYLLRVEDSEGNATTASLTVQSENAVTITSINRNTGPLDGGKWVQVLGTGISDSAEIRFGGPFGDACTDRIVVEPGKRWLCKTPAGATGLVDITIVNPLGSGTATLASGYTYGNTHLCDTALGQSGSPFASNNNGQSSDAPFQICTATQLANISSQPTGRYYSLEDNIDMHGVSMAPITNTGGSFNGTFNGNHHVVLNYSYSPGSATNDVGLFGLVNGGLITNLGVANVSIGGAAQQYVGGLIGRLAVTSGTFTGLWSTGTVSGTDIIGGLIGGSGATGYTLTHSFSRAAVSNSGIGTLPSSTLTSIGGLIGRSGASTITSCYTAGNVTSTVTTNSHPVGGLVGRSIGATNISDSYTKGNVTSSSIAGGLVGILSTGGTWSNVHATGTIAASGPAGGLLGVGSPSIIDSYYKGALSSTGTAGTSWLGGIVANGGNVSTTPYQGTLTRVYVEGSITTTSSSARVGGLVGLAGTATIQQSYFTGSLTGMGAGGLVSFAKAGTTSIIDSHANLSSVSTYTSGGGLIGGIDSTDNTARVDISRSYVGGGTISSPSGSAYYLGGIVGTLGAPTIASTITDSYSLLSANLNSNARFGGIASGNGTGGMVVLTRVYHAGTVQNGSQAAELKGIALTGVANCADAFFDSTRTATTNSGCASGASAKTTTEMQSEATFTNFNFTPTTGKWKMPETPDYPKLIWQP